MSSLAYPIPLPQDDSAKQLAFMDIATGWQQHLLFDAGCTYYARTDATDTTVVLGNTHLADGQRAADDAAGGLASLVCGYGRGR